MLLRQFTPVAYPTVLRLTTTMTLWISRAVLWLYKCHPVSQEESTELRNGTACIIFIVIKIFFPKTDMEDTDFTRITKLSVCNIQELWPVEPKWDWVAAGKMSAILKNAEITKVASGKGQGCRAQPARLPPTTAASSVQSRAKGQGPRLGHCLQSKGTAPPLWPALFSHTDVSNTRHTQSFMAAFLDLSWRGGKKS